MSDVRWCFTCGNDRNIDNAVSIYTGVLVEGCESKGHDVRDAVVLPKGDYYEKRASDEQHRDDCGCEQGWFRKVEG